MWGLGLRVKGSSSSYASRVFAYGVQGCRVPFHTLRLTARALGFRLQELILSGLIVWFWVGGL